MSSLISIYLSPMFTEPGPAAGGPEALGHEDGGTGVDDFVDLAEEESKAKN